MAYDLQLQHDIAEALDMADREAGFDSRRRSQSKPVSAPSEADLEGRPARLRNMNVKIWSRTMKDWVRAEVVTQDDDGSFYVVYNDEQEQPNWYGRTIFPDDPDWDRLSPRRSPPLILQNDVAKHLEEVDFYHGFNSRRRSPSELVSAPSKAVLEGRPAVLRNMKVRIFSRTIARVVRAEVMEPYNERGFYVVYHDEQEQDNWYGKTIHPDDPCWNLHPDKPRW